MIVGSSDFEGVLCASNSHKIESFFRSLPLKNKLKFFVLQLVKSEKTL